MQYLSPSSRETYNWYTLTTAPVASAPLITCSARAAMWP